MSGFQNSLPIGACSTVKFTPKYNNTLSLYHRVNYRRKSVCVDRCHNNWCQYSYTNTYLVRFIEWIKCIKSADYRCNLYEHRFNLINKHLCNIICWMFFVCMPIHFEHRWTVPKICYIHFRSKAKEIPYWNIVNIKLGKIIFYLNCDHGPLVSWRQS